MLWGRGRRSITVLGFMTGTSLDAIDMAIVHTDGEDILGLGPSGELKLDRDTQSLAEHATAEALQSHASDLEPASFEKLRTAVARAHVEAARTFLRLHPSWSEQIDLIGVHGQTVLHEPPERDTPGRTIQLIDAQLLADELRLPVISDFRSADMARGGQGAPLAPAYHAALIRRSGLGPPAAVLNLGGVANITYVHADGRIEAFDAGPANGMMDQLVQMRTTARMDKDGRLAAEGKIHADILERYLAHPFFAKPGAKSLDRYAFPLQPVAALSLPDGVATLTDFSAKAVALGLARFDKQPTSVIVTGGGRRNPALMGALRAGTGIPLIPAEGVGWRGDSVEAEAFAFLAARSLLRLPISFPETTGVRRPMSGGVLVHPRGLSDEEVRIDGSPVPASAREEPINRAAGGAY